MNQKDISGKTYLQEWLNCDYRFNCFWCDNEKNNNGKPFMLGMNPLDIERLKIEHEKHK